MSDLVGDLEDRFSRVTAQITMKFLTFWIGERRGLVVQHRIPNQEVLGLITT